MKVPKLNGVLETALYVSDVKRSRLFYESIFELSAMIADDRFCAFAVGNGNVLLLFQKASAREAQVLNGGVIPPHDASGEIHFAFAVGVEEMSEWERWLSAKGIPIESKVSWPRGGRSIYFRDPDQHLIELATPGLWPNY